MTLRRKAPFVLVLVSFFLLVRGDGRFVAEAEDGVGESAVLLADEARNEEASRAESAARAEREAILRLVRQHRRSANDAWCETLADAVYEEARAAGIDPLMVAAIVAKESSFRSRVVSHAGAVGLMQLRPFVARDLATRTDVEWDGIQTLHSPELNVRLGTLYYRELVERFDGDVRLALAAYNRGPTRVSRQLASGSFSGSRYADGILGLYEELSTSTLLES